MSVSLLLQWRQNTLWGRYSRIHRDSTETDIRRLLGEPYSVATKGNIGLCGVRPMEELLVVKKLTWIHADFKCTQVGLDRNGKVNYKESELVDPFDEFLFRFRGWIGW